TTNGNGSTSVGSASTQSSEPSSTVAPRGACRRTGTLPCRPLPPTPRSPPLPPPARFSRPFRPSFRSWSAARLTLPDPTTPPSPPGELAGGLARCPADLCRRRRDRHSCRLGQGPRGPFAPLAGAGRRLG